MFIHANPFVMELKLNETKKFEDLTVTLFDGGHKILMDEKGKRSGDLSYAEITLQTSSHSASNYRIYHPDGTNSFNRRIEFDQYMVTVKDMAWNGASIKLAIEKKSNTDQ